MLRDTAESQDRPEELIEPLKGTTYTLLCRLLLQIPALQSDLYTLISNPT